MKERSLQGLTSGARAGASVPLLAPGGHPVAMPPLLRAITKQFVDRNTAAAPDVERREACRPARCGLCRLGNTGTAGVSTSRVLERSERHTPQSVPRAFLHQQALDAGVNLSASAQDGQASAALLRWRLLEAKSAFGATDDWLCTRYQRAVAPFCVIDAPRLRAWIADHANHDLQCAALAQAFVDDVVHLADTVRHGDDSSVAGSGSGPAARALGSPKAGAGANEKAPMAVLCRTAAVAHWLGGGAAGAATDVALLPTAPSRRVARALLDSVLEGALRRQRQTTSGKGEVCPAEAPIGGRLPAVRHQHPRSAMPPRPAFHGADAGVLESVLAGQATRAAADSRTLPPVVQPHHRDLEQSSGSGGGSRGDRGDVVGSTCSWRHRAPLHAATTVERMQRAFAAKEYPDYVTN